MASPGFGVGDIIACTQLAAQTYRKLKDAPKEFDALRLELGGLLISLL